MTIVAAMNCGTHLLFGADSLCVNDDDTRVLVIKIQTLQNPPFAWAFAGDTNSGDPFNAWLTSRPWPLDETWERFAELAREALARENDAHVQRLALQSHRATIQDLAEVLIAGYLQSELRILHLPCQGGLAWRTHERLPSIGSGMRWILQVRWDLGGGFQADAVYLREVLEAVAARNSRRCSPPIHVVEVSPPGVRDVG